MIKRIFISLFVFLSPYMVLSDHMLNSSNAEALKSHKFRMGSMPKQFNSVLIGKKLQQVNLSKTSPNKMVSNMLSKTDLLSVILHDGNKVKINQFSNKIGERDRIYSMSIAKSFIGVLVGHAKCDGLISDLGNSAGQYLSETKGTIYAKQSIRNLINMTAGDSRSFNGDSMMNYAFPILTQKSTIKKELEKRIGGKSSDKKFFYSNITTDIVVNILDRISPNGFEKYFEQKISKNAKFVNKTRFLKDKNGWIIGHAFMYADRVDYVNFAMYLASSWKKNDCIGKYLKDVYNRRVSTKKAGNDYKSYGGFFWFDKPMFKFSHIAMRGHGGHRVIINLDTGAILSAHAIRRNFSSYELDKLMTY